LKYRSNRMCILGIVEVWFLWCGGLLTAIVNIPSDNNAYDWVISI